MTGSMRHQNALWTIMFKFSFEPSLVPPDMYRAVMPDGTVIRSAGRANWFYEISEHYRRNGYTLPENWREYYEDRLCKILPPGFCVNECGHTVNSQDIRITADDLKHGAHVLWEISRSPDPLVDKELACKRAATCAACVANIHVEGCLSCFQLSNIILDIKGKGTTPADAYLRQCAVCKCPNQAQVWVKPELLVKDVNGEQLRRMEELNSECWKAAECKALLEIQPT